jgi:hypothetical protein
MCVMEPQNSATDPPSLPILRCVCARSFQTPSVAFRFPMPAAALDVDGSVAEIEVWLCNYLASISQILLHLVDHRHGAQSVLLPT